MAECFSDYRAFGVLRNAHIQSILSSSPWRKWLGRRRLQKHAVSITPKILNLPNNIKLSGLHYAALKPRAEKVLMILLHGWEGSAESSYIQHSAAEFVQAGMDVFALNFRDHGQSHHLNEGIFHSCRLQEICDAVLEIQQQFAPQKLLIGGYSLGGNFALRVAANTQIQQLPLRAVFAICPPVNPSQVMQRLETGTAFYHGYFMYKWRKSLRLKRQYFPSIHTFDNVFLQNNMRKITQWLVAEHTEWPDEEAYFSAYSVSNQVLEKIVVPCFILTAEDDPIIPIQSLRALHYPDSIQLEVAKHGGHCGFIQNWRMQGFAEKWLLQNALACVSDSSPEQRQA